MPHNAIATQVAQHVIPPHHMAEALRCWVEDTDFPVAEVPSDPLKFILQQLNHHTKIEFSAYKPATVLRRIERRMQAVGLDDMTPT